MKAYAKDDDAEPSDDELDADVMDDADMEDVSAEAAFAGPHLDELLNVADLHEGDEIASDAGDLSGSNDEFIGNVPGKQGLPQEPFVSPDRGVGT